MSVNLKSIFMDEFFALTKIWFGLSNSLASIPCVHPSEPTGSNHCFLDTTQQFAVIPSQWFPEGANPIPAHFWNRLLHTANHALACPLQTKSDAP
jgi:hypothetical protein